MRAVHVPQKGRGRALRQVWGASDADVVAYMDVDLSTGLEALLPLVAPLLSGHSDLAIGTRLANGAAVVRGPRRELVSRCYNLLLRTTMRARFSDAQCGFKAGRTEVVQALLPAVEDQAWFFDTELLLAAQRGGLRIHEVPVDWVEDTDSRVDVVRTALGRPARHGPGASRWPPGLFWVLRSVTGAMRQRRPRRGGHRCQPPLHLPPGCAAPGGVGGAPPPPPPSIPAAPPEAKESRDHDHLDPRPARRRPPPAGRLARLVRGRADDPAWARPALLGLLAATALLYLWALGASGWANDFYSAAAQAASQSWKAFFFGSSDASNFITVDKPPASLWVMGLSARLFGVSSWSLLGPQALMGVATVALLYATVRRWFGPAAGLLAGAVLALTPVATLIFRFNNPDALLTLLLVAGAYAVVRALEGGATRWLVLAGACVGFGFLAKQLQALLVVPAFALVYLAAAPGSLGRRLGQLVAGRGRDGGLGRLVGRDRRAAAGVGPAVHRRLPDQQHPRADLRLQRPGPAHRRRDRQRRRRPGGRLGPDRLDPHVRGRGRRPDRLAAPGRPAPAGRRAVADPAGAAHQPGQGRVRPLGRVAGRHRGRVQLHAGHLPRLLRRRPRPGRRRAGRHGRHRPVGGAPPPGDPLVAGRDHGRDRRLVVGAAAAHARLAPRAGPAGAAGRAGRGRPDGGRALAGGGHRPGRAGAAAAGGRLAVAWPGPGCWSRWPGRPPTRSTPPPPRTAAPSPRPARPSRAAAPAAARGGGFRGGGGPPPGFGDGGGGPFGQAARQPGGAGPGRRPRRGGRRGGMGGLLDGGTPDAELVALLQQDADRYTWVAAAVGSNSAAGVQLATGEPVMAIGGFNGSDPAPTLEQFQRYVAEGRIHWFLGGRPHGRGPWAAATPPGRSPPGSRRASPRPASAGPPSTT